jgi:indole-3-glycerol phosphate synthase
MMNILEEIAAYTTKRIEEAKRQRSASELEKEAFALPKGDFAFEKALRKEGLSFICEVKRASPSRGIIAQEFPYVRIAQEYAAAGADAISCLTEPKWFLGSDAIFGEIRRKVGTPMLRKDFTVSPYQIRQARIMGANAVLLICAILTERELAEYLGLCGELGLAALTETHDETEIGKSVRCGAKIIGVNNRNLHDFSVDNSNSTRLRDLVPADRIFVSESGIRTPEDVAAVRRAGADAVLIGETVMRAADKAAALDKLRSLV